MGAVGRRYADHVVGSVFDFFACALRLLDWKARNSAQSTPMAVLKRLVPTHVVSFADHHMFPIYFDHQRHLLMVQADELLGLLKGGQGRFKTTLYDRLKSNHLDFVSGCVLRVFALGVGRRGRHPYRTSSSAFSYGSACHAVWIASIGPAICLFD